MNTQFYTERRKFVKYDKDHYLLYLNEEACVELDEAGKEIGGYKYTGTFEDGGTKIVAKDANYEAFVAGMIRARYTADAVEAITLNYLSGDSDRSPEFTSDMSDLNDYREYCKGVARIMFED